jgi:PIN domain nuclease of toxin-antitoxin system
MRLLLDTHSFLWWTGAPERLPSSVRAALLEPANQLYLSAASSWEIQIKTALGRLELSRRLRSIVEREISRNGLRLLPITFDHTQHLGGFGRLHRDPFDRILMAQAVAEEMTLVSGDTQVHRYGGVSLLWE